MQESSVHGPYRQSDCYDVSTVTRWPQILRTSYPSTGKEGSEQEVVILPQEHLRMCVCLCELRRKIYQDVVREDTSCVC